MFTVRSVGTDIYEQKRTKGLMKIHTKMSHLCSAYYQHLARSFIMATLQGRYYFYFIGKKMEALKGKSFIQGQLASK